MLNTPQRNSPDLHQSFHQAKASAFSQFQIGLRRASFDELAGLGLQSIVIYGGTFDPPHLSHLEIAKRLKECADLVIIIPTAHNPLKANNPVASDEHRINMLEAMIKHEDKIVILTNEIERAESTESSSKTIDTLREARIALPDMKIYFALGVDCLPQLHQWHCWEELKELAEFIPIARACEAFSTWGRIEQSLGSAYTGKLKDKLISNDSIGSASSSDIRKSFANGKSTASQQLPVPVAEYIDENGLYKQFNRD